MEHSMQRLNFDKLRFVKKLSDDKSYTNEQAEALADAFDEALTQSQSPLATKSDLDSLRQELRQELKATENRLLYAIGASFAATTTILIAVLGLMKFV
ncbi:hypothetical protein SAMN05660772_02456 [Pasteurella testudinis DSM 23072]|uniref:Uncharacterized protein n=1 Tax=Pasteurella testudinis DSM 23072 TaxID=1122938 RepID=A0A1W1UW44_9PAST|nr:hypothetical protein [Pasteurella testudinis]SMB85256.1 hypothetical protein SAMN05660772_02456 [Pasteurella testudinis DSM 23072]SUB52145.1 Uncharacterised protein [Pasteurella testudinis]